MEKKELRKLDLVFSVVLIACSIFYMIESIKLFMNPFGRSWDRVTEESVAELIRKWCESPALVPFMVSILLLICAICLLVVAWKAGARFSFSGNNLVEKFKTDKEFRTFITVAGSLGVYIYILMPLCRSFLNVFRGFQGFPFLVATFIYMSFTSIVFSRKTKNDIVMGLVVSLIASTAISVLFNKVALIPLP